MRILFSVLVVVLIITTLSADEIENQDLDEAKPSSLLNLEDAKIQELEDISAISQDSPDTEVTRKKKSTTTTFCVEIRPSNPYQKPFQVCEPAEPAKTVPYPPPDGNYYAAPSYGGPEQPKTLGPFQPAAASAYKPASQPKPAPAYSAPVKTFSSPSVVPPHPSHPSLSYSSYRAKNAESAAHEHSHDHMMRMTQAEEDEERHSSESMSEKSRSASYGSASYGAPTSFVPVVPKEKHKAHGHNGLVITCQPNLAGYAHNVPSSFHHPSAVSYSYRSSGPGSWRRNDARYGGYRAQLQSYGNVQAPAVGPGPVLKPLMSGYSASASNSISPSSSQFRPVYRHQAYGPPPQYQPSPPPPPPPPVFPSPFSVSTHSSQPLPSGPSFGQPPPPPPQASSYGPAPQQHISAQASAALPSGQVAAGFAPPQSYASYSQAPAAFAPAPAASAAFASAPARFPAPGPASSIYGPAPPPPPLPAPSAPSALPVLPQPPAPVYSPPGTYLREAEDSTKMLTSTTHRMNKEEKTLKKMQEMSQQRAASTQWNSEVSTDSTQQKSTEEQVQASQQGWGARAANNSGDEKAEMEQDAKANEVEN